MYLWTRTFMYRRRISCRYGKSSGIPDEILGCCYSLVPQANLKNNRVFSVFGTNCLPSNALSKMFDPQADLGTQNILERERQLG